MQIVRGTLESPLCVDSELEVQGTVSGSIRVRKPGRLVLRGVCKGHVVLEAGARAELWGIVQGNLINEGGHVSLFGLLEGHAERSGGTTCISADSIVRGGFRPSSPATKP